MISDGNMTKNGQYLYSACNNYVKTLLDQKQYVSFEKESQINNTDKNDVEINTITNQVENLIKILKSSKFEKLKHFPNDQIGELLRLLGILFRF